MSTPSPAFVQDVCTRLRAQHPDAQVFDDVDAVIVHHQGAGAMLHPLGALWEQVDGQNAPAMAASIERWIATLPVPDAALELLPNLRVLVRPRTVHATLVAGQLWIVQRDRIPGLDTLLVCAQGASLRLVDRALVDAGGLDVDAAFERATQNTWEALQPLVSRTTDGTLLELRCAGVDAATLLALPPLWASLQAELWASLQAELWASLQAERGALVVGVPLRSLLWVVSEEDAEGQDELDRRLLAAAGRPEQLSGAVYTQWGAQWVVAREPSTAVSRYEARIVTVRELRELRPGIEDRTQVIAPGVFRVFQAREGAPVGQMSEADLAELLAERAAHRRTRLTTEPDGTMLLTDAGGPAADLVLGGSFDQLDPSLLLGLPSRGSVVLAPPHLEQQLRLKVRGIFDAAGADALSCHLFTREARGLRFWPSERPCDNCGSVYPSTAKFCWSCGESVCERLLWRWTSESLVPTALIIIPFWLAGGETHWFFTTWLIWGEVYVLGWIPRARFKGYSTAQALGGWIDSVYRWVVVFAPLICLLRFPGWVQLLLAGPELSLSGALGWAMQLASVPLLAALFVLTVRVLGWSAVDPRHPYPTVD